MRADLAVRFPLAVLKSKNGQLAVAFGAVETQYVVVIATRRDFFGRVLGSTYEEELVYVFVHARKIITCCDK